MSKPEDVQQADIKYTAACEDNVLWRNNNGAYKDEYGNFIRYGLANETAQMNKKIKSSDLIGITQVLITPEMVGQTIGVFTAVEVKKEAWKHVKKLTEHEMAQAKFHQIVRDHGGLAGFAACVDDYYGIILHGD